MIEVNYIEQQTNTTVKVLEEKTATSPDAVGKTDANSVAIFNPDIKDATDAKPKKIRKVEEVATERKAKGICGQGSSWQTNNALCPSGRGSGQSKGQRCHQSTCQ